MNPLFCYPSHISTNDKYLMNTNKGAKGRNRNLILKFQIQTFLVWENALQIGGHRLGLELITNFLIVQTVLYCWKSRWMTNIALMQCASTSMRCVKYSNFLTHLYHSSVWQSNSLSALKRSKLRLILALLKWSLEREQWDVDIKETHRQIVRRIILIEIWAIYETQNIGTVD